MFWQQQAEDSELYELDYCLKGEPVLLCLPSLSVQACSQLLEMLTCGGDALQAFCWSAAVFSHCSLTLHTSCYCPVRSSPNPCSSQSSQSFALGDLPPAPVPLKLSKKSNSSGGNTRKNSSGQVNFRSLPVPALKVIQRVALNPPPDLSCCSVLAKLG